jgi:ER-bound oxygenase mpaB/B'/Rubber oxygenase, catalytic domain
MEQFVNSRSVVRKIWGNSDTILVIFAGAAAEFALNKAVDWLYFTGRLPANPLKRLFSTVAYARLIVFSDLEKANQIIDKMYDIHASVEEKRASKIPDWAYRDVLYMLIDYSIRSFEVMERKLTHEERGEVYGVFERVGKRMKLSDLPSTYENWLISREQHLSNDMAYSIYTADLYKQYLKHLGRIRYFLLKETQALVVPSQVADLLKLGRTYLIKTLLFFYKITRALRINWFLKNLILPSEYKAQIKSLDII